MLKGFSRSSIARTMFGGFLFVIIPTIILGIASNMIGMSVASDGISRSYANSLTLLSGQLADKMYNLDMLAASILLDDDAIRLANQPQSKSDLFDFVIFRNRILLYRTPQFIDANITVCFPEQNRLVSTRWGVCRMDDYMDIDHLADGDRKNAIWSIRPSLFDESTDCISIVRGLIRTGQSNPFVILEIPQAEMVKTLDTMMLGSPVAQMFFFDWAGNFISAGEPVNGATWIELEPALQSDDGNQYKERRLAIGREEHLMIYQPVKGYNCWLGALINESKIKRPVANIRMLFLLFMIFALFASLFFINLAYKKIFAPMRSLLAAMTKLESGDLRVRAEVLPHNELAIMSKQFNEMVARLNGLISDVYIKELKLKNAQLRFLRSQINPHFLYNSLFSLYNMIQCGDFENASYMAIYLGNYYRQSARFDQKELTIAEETRNIEMYMKIFAIRFPGRLKMETYIDPEAQELKIPILSLQTIVENAILHGMEGSSRECVVSIYAHIEHGALYLSVRDTGNGISPQELERIQERLKYDIDADDNHGLENVYLRLKLMYGDRVLMHIQNNDPCGTRVDIEVLQHV